MYFRKLAPTIIAAVFSLTAMSCSNSIDSSTPNDGELDLNSEFGGYTASDESPAFGDASFASAMSAEPLFDDPLYPADAVDSLLDDGKTVYALVLRWGQLEGDSTVTTLTDWSGSLELLRGGIALRQTIRFEAGQDHIVRPRTSRKLLEWVSFTSVHFDGLLVLIHDPVVDDDSVVAPNELVLTMPQYARSFSMEELDSLDEIVDIDASGNQLAINARRLDLVLCGEGSLEGIWRLNPSHRNGEFFGRWMTAGGAFGGHLRGHFGIRGDSSRVFFGKVIGVDGSFAGLLRGAWGFNDSDSTGGWFEGDWASSAGLTVGSVAGTWVSAPVGDADDDDGRGNGNGRGRGHNRNSRWGGGFFTGWWEKSCDADSVNSGA